MENIGLEALKMGGIAGFLIVAVLCFCGWLFHKTMIHFMASSDRKDTQITDICTKFTIALNANIEAVHQLDGTIIKLSSAMDNIIDGNERIQIQHREEHSEILDFVRNARRLN